MIPRIGASVTFYGLAVLRQFEVMGVYPLNESVAIGRSRDKLRCLQLLARRGIGLPVTAFTHDPKQAEDIIDLVGGAPVVIKLLEGTQGIGVVLGETVKSAKSVIEAFQGVNVNILVQEFIKEADATDIRALVIGEKVVAAMKRSGPPGDFRSNLHRGGVGEMVRITPQERSAAVRAARTLGLNVCGVDMLRSKSGPLVLEVNSSPGIEGLEKATGVDVARPDDRIPRAPRRPGPDPHQGQRLIGLSQTPWQIDWDAARKRFAGRILALKSASRLGRLSNDCRIDWQPACHGS